MGRWLVFLLVLAGCSPWAEPQQKKSLQDAEVSVFTGRSELGTEVVLLLELHEPALLARFPARPSKRSAAAREWRAHEKALTREQNLFFRQVRELVPSATLEQRYSLVFNGLAIRVPKQALSELSKLPGRRFQETAGAFARPHFVPSNTPLNPARTERWPGGLPKRSPIDFVGASKLHEKGLRGAGVRIGIVDTGIDYTHVAFTGRTSGNGSPEDASTSASLMSNLARKARELFASNHPDVVERGTFPTAKVVGGVDLVGSEFDALSPRPEVRRPKPDNDPMDEGFHGTHVAALAAGSAVPEKGFAGGVAPEASLFAIKIFGRDGGTSDEIILAALETAADPDGNGFADDALSVVNFSLGSRYGTPSSVHARAVRALSRAGTLVVAAVGNEGATPFVVGAPATVEEALAVAASVDDSDWNWRARAVEFFFSSGTPSLPVEAVEGEDTLPLANLTVQSPVPLVDLGAGNVEDFNKVGSSLAGKVVLVDRGGLSFDEKLQLTAAAGGVGLIVSNVIDEEPFSMGGDTSHAIPGIMVRGSLGKTLREELSRGEVRIDFSSTKTIDTPSIIDTIAPFSSRGPRAQDGLLKPDLSAPGLNVQSAAAGSGAEFVLSSGSSMAAPLVAGAAALLEEATGERGQALKVRLMNGAALLEGKGQAPTSTGAGRLDVPSSAQAALLVEPASVSMGAEAFLPEGATVELTLTNTSQEARTALLKWPTQATPAQVSLEMVGTSPAEVLVPAGESRRVQLKVRSKSLEQTEAWAFLRVADDVGQEAVVPLYAASLPTAKVVVSGDLRNDGARDARTLVFSRYFEDDLSGEHGPCDLAGLGLRVREGRFLQAAFVSARPVSTFALCEPSLLIDTDSNGVADYELTAARGSELSRSSFGGLPAVYSFLLDAFRTREVRSSFDATWRGGHGRSPDFADAVVDLQDVDAPAAGGLILLQLDLARIPSNRPLPNQGVFQFAALFAGTSEAVAKPDDVLGNAVSSHLVWQAIDLEALSASDGIVDGVMKAGDRVALPTLPLGGVLIVPENEAGKIVLPLGR